MHLPVPKGAYRFKPQLIACRSAHCYHCNTVTLFEEFRAFTVVHVLFIPVLPVGFTTRWICSTCEKEPNEPQGKIVVAALFGALLFYFGCIIGYEDSLPTGLALMAGGIAIPAIAYRRTAKKVQPTGNFLEACPYCRSPLLTGTKTQCEKCDVSIYNA